MTDGRSFGAWLRRERERRAITVRAIADRTKIGAGLLEALERGDVSRWPGGIYRRAFMRSYADAVGLDAELVLANFERVFPSEDRPAPPVVVVPESAGAADAPDEREGMRLQLAVAPPPAISVLPAVRTACLDVAFVLAFGFVGLLAAGAIGFWCAAAVAAVVHHVIGVLGLWGQEARRASPRADSPAPARHLAQVVAFSDEQSRTTSRRARARRMAASLSAVAHPAVSFRRRRAARS